MSNKIKSKFWLWRKMEQQKQSDVEAKTGILRWKLSLLDSGIDNLTDKERAKLSKVTEIPENLLAFPIDTDTDEATGEFSLQYATLVARISKLEKTVETLLNLRNIENTGETECHKSN